MMEEMMEEMMVGVDGTEQLSQSQKPDTHVSRTAVRSVSCFKCNVRAYPRTLNVCTDH